MVEGKGRDVLEGVDIGRLFLQKLDDYIRKHFEGLTCEYVWSMYDRSCGSKTHNTRNSADYK